MSPGARRGALILRVRVVLPSEVPCASSPPPIPSPSSSLAPTRLPPRRAAGRSCSCCCSRSERVVTSEIPRLWLAAAAGGSGVLSSTRWASGGDVGGDENGFQGSSEGGWARSEERRVGEEGR